MKPWVWVLAVCIYGVIFGYLAVRASNSMTGRGAKGWPYGLLVFVLPPLGILTWYFDGTSESSIEGDRWIDQSGQMMTFILKVLTFPLVLFTWYPRNRGGSKTP